MKKLTLVTFVFILSSFLGIKESNAQAPCGGAIGIGPFGIGVVIDCPPPLPPPPPRVIIIKRRARRCAYAPVRRAPRPVARVQAPVPVVKAPTFKLRRYAIENWTLGVLFDSSSFDDGALTGGGIFARLRLTPQVAIETSFTGLSSCTNCNEFASRDDNRFGVSGLYYFSNIRRRGLNLYAKAGIIFNNITFTDPNYNETSTTQTLLEAGGGIEWRLTPWLSLNAEATVMGGAEGENIGVGTINENVSKGIPSADQDNGAFNIRFGISTNF